jgi:hypothetical protein
VELKGHSKFKRGTKGKIGAQGVNTGTEDEKNIVWGGEGIYRASERGKAGL